MGRKRRFGRPLSGVVLIDKARGMTSNDVVQRAKRLFFAAKAGHTGALDPLATGILPICFGEATKFSQYLLAADKTYVSTFCFGVKTDTGDAEGEIIREQHAGALTAKQVEDAIKKRYIGEIRQVPPMYSALKRAGKPLYKLAREGKEIVREARHVRIDEFKLTEFKLGVKARAEVRIKCSKGTYVRTLAEDLGTDLGVGAHVAALRRVQTGEFNIDDALSLSALEDERADGRAEVLDHHLLGVDAAIGSLPKVVLDDDTGYYFARGQAVMDSEVYRIAEEGDKVRVFRAEGQFLGLGEVIDDGRVTPKRLVACP